MIRAACPSDVETVIALIRELAEYEKLLDQCHADSARLREDLFGELPGAEVFVATSDDGATTCDDGAAAGEGPIVGYALGFPIYSTFETRRCYYLEDLYVTPAARGVGFGRALLARVAVRARQLECPRLDWNVLAWNRGAIDFYAGFGADVLTDWRVCRLQGEALARVADLAGKIG